MLWAMFVSMLSVVIEVKSGNMCISAVLQWVEYVVHKGLVVWTMALSKTLNPE